MNITEFQFYIYAATVLLLGMAGGGVVAFRPGSPVTWLLSAAFLIGAAANLIILVLAIFGLPL